MVNAQAVRDGRDIDPGRAGMSYAVVVGAVVLVWLLAGESGAQVRNPDGVAVIIGNRAYQYDVPEVTYAHRDAEAFRHYVVGVLGFDPKDVIHKQDTDKATLERVFGNRDSLKGSELWRHLHPEGRSDVVVFYSGHGISGSHDKLGYLLPVNAHPDTAELEGYPIDVLYNNLVKLKEKKEARSIHVFLDACFSGDSGGGRLIASTSAIRVAPIKESIDTLTILTAASGKEVASWDKTAKHGLFTHHLLDAVYGGADADANGEVTAVEAKVYLDRHMTLAARRLYGRVQNADLQGMKTAVLARAVGGRFPERPALTPTDAKQGAVVEKHPAERRFRDCPACPEMVVVSAGSYEMGSLDSEAGRSRTEGPVHRVTLPQPFAVGVYEVTRGEFGLFVEATGYSTGDACWTYERDVWKKRQGHHWRNPGFKQTDRHPVTCVSWEDAKAYVQWMSQETGQSYRLLSEAEWEYVARGGPRSRGYRYAGSFAPELVAWYHENSGEATHPVGQKVPNELGLYDMSGNVWEWVEDCWNDSYRGAPGDGRAWKSGTCSNHVVRGGSWGNIPGGVRSAIRVGYGAGGRSSSGGFRVARTLD